jgi:hypothetical protein
VRICGCADCEQDYQEEGSEVEEGGLEDGISRVGEDEVRGEGPS